MAAGAHFEFTFGSLLNAFLAISDRYASLFFIIFDKMTAVDLISGYFRSILIFFTKWPPAAILDVRKSLLIAFLAISDRSVILDVRNSPSMAFFAISDPYGS